MHEYSPGAIQCKNYTGNSDWRNDDLRTIVLSGGNISAARTPTFCLLCGSRGGAAAAGVLPRVMGIGVGQGVATVIERV